MKDIHRMRKEMRAENNKYDPLRFVDIQKDKWPPVTLPPFRVCRSSRFLCQLYNDKGFTRISINRVEINDQGGWKDGITWDELQNIKSQLGYAHEQAVEVFPAEEDLVNVSNIRHLWIVPATQIPFLWRNNRPTAHPKAVEQDKHYQQFRREVYGDWSKHEQPLTSGTPLYHRMLVAEYATPKQRELVCDVWKPTPYVYDVKTGDRYEEIRLWCNTNLGHESSPIHSQPGQWHFANVTMRGWTWIGFDTEQTAKRFHAAFPAECAPPAEQVSARERAKA